MRTGVDAVQAEGAIHVAHLAGLKQGQLATANHDQVGAGSRLSSNAVLGVASGADVGSRTFTSKGESVEATKLNCPMGQTNLQNDACLKRPSTTSTARK